MASSTVLTRKIAVFQKAVQGFSTVLNMDLTSFDPVVADAVRNGAVQKFEFCCELSWKTIKAFLYEIHGVDARTPKAAMKEFFLAGYFDQDECDLSLEMVDDRNLVSHVYREQDFLAVFSKMPNYLNLMRNIILRLEKESQII